MGSGGGRSNSAKWKNGRGECANKGEGDTFRASGDNVNTVTTVVGEGRAKIVGAVPVRVPRKTVVGAVEGKT